MIKCDRCGTLLTYKFTINVGIGAITNGVSVYPDIPWMIGDIKKFGTEIDVNNLYCEECDRHPTEMYIECYSCGERFVFSNNRGFRDIVNGKTYVNTFICRSCLGEDRNDNEIPF